MNHEKWLGLAEVYSLGALDGAELAEFENHLAAGCSLCENCLTETGEALAVFPKSLESAQPSAALKARIMDEIAESIPVMAGAPGSRSWALAAAGGWLLMSLVVVLSWNLSQTRKEMHSFQMMMASPTAREMEMKGMEPSPKAAGKMIFDQANHKCVFVAMGLSNLPEGKIYELWGLVGNETVPAGTFKVDEHGCAMLNLSGFPRLHQFQKFAVTLEPAGGVSKPTGAMHLLGALNA